MEQAYIYIQMYIFIAYKTFWHFYIKIFNRKILNINRIRDLVLSEKGTMLYEGGAMFMWQNPVVLYETWITWLHLFLQENPPEEENDKNMKMKKKPKSGMMEVNDDLFPSKYEPHEIKIKYKNETIELIPEWEEMAFWKK